VLRAQALSGLAAWLLASAAHASGASPYVPLNLSPEIERQIERVLLLGGQTVMRRPIPVSRVLLALPKACKRDAVLCAQVRRYLDRYFGTAGVTHAGIEVAAASHSTQTLPNEHGERIDSPVDGSAVLFYRPEDHVLLTAGGVAYAGTDGRFNPDGTLVSGGDEYLQVDTGWRDQWLSPMTDSSMLVSTEAPTMPSITVSNQEPLAVFGLDYELFLARMSHAAQIVWGGSGSTECGSPNQELRCTSGDPSLAGFHVGIEPVSGWALAANAIYQYGGGVRPDSYLQLLGHLFGRTSISDGDTDSRYANRAISFTSAYTVTGPTPFEAYTEYAARDTFHGEFYRYHQTSLSAGLHFPDLARRFDLTLEASEWQNNWYGDYVWLEGLTENGLVIGNWGADWRTFANTTGARSAMAQLGFPLAWGDSIDLRYRWLQNAGYGSVCVSCGPPQSYSVAEMLTAEYAQPRNGYTRGLELDAGRDEFGSGFVRLAAFVRFDGGRAVESDSEEADDEPSEDLTGPSFERFVDVGVSSGRLGLDLLGFTAAEETAPVNYHDETSPHLGVGVRRQVGTYSDLGVRAEFDYFNGPMLALRVLDYRYRLGRHLAAGLFAGYARYSGTTPAQGYYYGAGLQWRRLWRDWDASLDFRDFDYLQRDKLLSSDPQNGDPAEAYRMTALSLYLSHRF
jgi:hypothetical protein